MTAMVSTQSVTGRGRGGDTIQYTDLSATVTHNQKTAKIVCPYPDSHVSDTKFLCKGENPLNCEELIKTPESGRNEGKDRITIRDNQRMKHFTVHIKRMATADFGTYWCGSGRRPHASYTKVHLVNDGSIQTKRPGPKQTTAAPSSTAAHHGHRSHSGDCINLILAETKTKLILNIHSLVRQEHPLAAVSFSFLVLVCGCRQDWHFDSMSGIVGDSWDGADCLHM